MSSIPVVDIELTDYSAPINPPKVEIKFSTITKRTSVPKLFPFVVVDVETTGLDSKEDEIIEISAIKYEEDFTPVSCFTTLLQSHKSISVEARAVNHIDDSMVAGKPYFAEVAGSFSHYIANCNVVGHNLLFDLKFLHSSGTVLPSDKRFFDTLDIAKHTLTSPRSTIWDDYLQEKVPVEDYDVEDYKLETLCDYYKIYRDNAHRSLSDCLATAKLFENLVIARQGESIEN